MKSRRVRALAWRIAISTLSCLAGCTGTSAPDPRMHQLGSVEVTARLAEIKGEFPPNDLYDYAYVLKYEVQQVHRGQIPGKTILVGHYNPLKPRDTAADERSGAIGGNVNRFQPGDVHRMALEAPLENVFMGGIINEYFVEGEEQTLYWAWWTERVSG